MLRGRSVAQRCWACAASARIAAGANAVDPDGMAVAECVTFPAPTESAPVYQIVCRIREEVESESALQQAQKRELGGSAGF